MAKQVTLINSDHFSYFSTHWKSVEHALNTIIKQEMIEKQCGKPKKGEKMIKILQKIIKLKSKI